MTVMQQPLQRGAAWLAGNVTSPRRIEGWRGLNKDRHSSKKERKESKGNQFFSRASDGKSFFSKMLLLSFRSGGRGGRLLCMCLNRLARLLLTCTRLKACGGGIQTNHQRPPSPHRPCLTPPPPLPTVPILFQALTSFLKSSPRLSRRSKWHRFSSPQSNAGP